MRYLKNDCKTVFLTAAEQNDFQKGGVNKFLVWK